MKKAISLALIAILFLALFAGCNTYRRPAYTGTVVDGGSYTTRDFQYRADGSVTNVGRATNGTHTGVDTRNATSHYGSSHRADGVAPLMARQIGRAHV